MKNKLFKRISLSLALALCGLSLLGSPATTLPVQAAGGDGGIASPQAEILEWVFATFDGKLYKRLWNTSTGQWAGDWIYVRDL